jgi:hypothetical protein
MKDRLRFKLLWSVISFSALENLYVISKYINDIINNILLSQRSFFCAQMDIFFLLQVQKILILFR